jgi:MSHA biogenesis protein MshO
MKGLRGRRAAGFTLVEAVMVMVITAILAGVAVLFIRQPVKNYTDSAARADMADAADLALRRMARELHGALPNSIRTTVLNGSTSLLEFIPTKAGGRYLAAEDGADPAAHRPLDFTTARNLNFEVVGPMPAAPYAIAAGDEVVVYNLGTGFSGADAYAGANRATITAVAGKTITLAKNTLLDANGNANSSPGNRFNVINGGANGAVTFMCVNDAVTGQGQLTRFSHAITANLAIPAGQGERLAGNVFGCQFSVNQLANQQTALVGLSIALARSAPGSGGNGLETVTLFHQIHVDNTP